MNLIKKCRITWLSSEKLEKISFGEITNHKTINNRSWKPEFGGLFDPVVFGPFLNYECYCGKYKEKQNKWLTCEQCKVLVAEKNIQRWRMGHIKLASPVTNILIFKAISPLLSKILEIPAKELENIIYFQSYVILDNGLSKVVEKKKTFTKKTGFQWITKVLDEIEEKVKKEIEENEIIKEARELKNEIIKEARELKNEIESDLLKSNIIFFEDYLDFIAEHQKVKVSTGSEALEKLLKKINLQEELIKAEKKKKWNEFRFIKALIKNNIKLESIIVHNVPVIPCGLRPATRLKNEDTVATTQINNLYRKKILINEHTNDYNERNKVHRIFLEDVVNNEKRRLQKAYERLIHISSSKMNENKSLLKVLSGKEGILRRHSLGKRVDYSARSVIVPNPDLSLDQIGIPVKMALILYKFHLIREILSNELAFTVRNAEELLKKNEPKIFPLLNKIIHNYPLLINRAPTLHRLGIQGFYPKLTIG